jgi:manganese transport protein
LGHPPEEILKTAAAEQSDLSAMASQGHRWLGDLILGSTIDEVRHRAAIPILVVGVEKK